MVINLRAVLSLLGIALVAWLVITTGVLGLVVLVGAVVALLGYRLWTSGFHYWRHILAPAAFLLTAGLLLILWPALGPVIGIIVVVGAAFFLGNLFMGPRMMFSFLTICLGFALTFWLVASIDTSPVAAKYPVPFWKAIDNFAIGVRNLMIVYFGCWLIVWLGEEFQTTPMLDSFHLFNDFADWFLRGSLETGKAHGAPEQKLGGWPLAWRTAIVVAFTYALMDMVAHSFLIGYEMFKELGTIITVLGVTAVINLFMGHYLVGHTYAPWRVFILWALVMTFGTYFGPFDLLVFAKT